MTRPEESRKPHRRTVARLILVVVGMFAFGYALVPLYRVFCEITGANGKTGRTSDSQIRSLDLNRVITVELTGAVNSDLPWRFAPVVKKIDVHPGAPTETEFFAENISGQARDGQAVPSIAPGEASKYFSKTECFCFTRQTLAAGEGRRMRVRFVVDDKLPEHIRTLTLSYTFFSVGAQPVATPKATATTTSEPDKRASKGTT